MIKLWKISECMFFHILITGIWKKNS